MTQLRAFFDQKDGTVFTAGKTLKGENFVVIYCF